MRVTILSELAGVTNFVPLLNELLTLLALSIFKAKALFAASQNRVLDVLFLFEKSESVDL